MCLSPKLLSCLCLFFVSTLWHLSWAQSSVSISFLRDNEVNSFDKEIQSEIEQLLSETYTLSFQTYDFSDLLSPGRIARIYQESDLVISTGINASFLITAQEAYPKPTIISFVFDSAIQNIPATQEGSSGVENFTYVSSPFNLKRDFQTLYDIKPYTNVAVVSENNNINIEAEFTQFLSPFIPDGAQFGFVNLRNNVDELITELKPYDAVYFLTGGDIIEEKVARDLYTKLADEGKVTFSLINDPYIDQGVYAAYETSANLQRIPRRVALNTMKILEGEDAASLPVEMSSFTEDLLINMAAVNRSGIYPSFELMNASTLQNLSGQMAGEQGLSLQQAIAEGLQHNLQLSIAKRQVEIGNKDIQIARGNLLPQVNGTASVFSLDEARTLFQGQGSLGRYNINTGLDFSQVVFSEPALANITIQKLINESNKYALAENELDVIQNVVNAYIGIQQTKALVELNNDNLNVTRQNFNISKVKNTIGESGASDVYRWESQQAIQNIELNNALVQMDQARFQLNFLLNRPISDDQPLTELNENDMGMLVSNDNFRSRIDNQKKLEQLADFFVIEARTKLPEVKQIEASIKAQERNLTSQKRAFYLPQLAFSGSYTEQLGHYQVPEGVMRIDDVPSQYELALGMQIPIFQGNIRNNRVQQSKVQILQTEDNKELLQDNLELSVRSTMIVASTSYRNRELAYVAADAASKNFEIAQNSYREGLLNITSLIDAQNAMLQAKINATNAEYTFIRDFVALERSYGSYYFLLSPSEQEAFIIRILDFVTQE